MSKQPKSLSQKSSEKLCENMRIKHAQGFKEMAKILSNRERTSNNADCLAKLQLLMASYPQLAQQLNEYLEEPIRFPVHKSFPQKIEEFFSYVKTRNLEHMINTIIQTLRKFEKETKTNEAIQTKQSEQKLIEKFLELFKDDEEAYNKAKDIFQHTDSKERPPPAQPVRNRAEVEYFNSNYRQGRREPVRATNNRVVVEPPRILIQAQKYPPDDMEFILKFEKSWSPAKFSSITKVIFLFEHCVISMNEALDLIPDDIFESFSDYQIFKDMIETRQGSRRRTSNPFKPLNDTDFSNSIRATFSYVQMPWCYPILCKGKNKQLRSILNDKWVSVPHGSEHSNFYIRTKNQFQELLLKSQDERYEFDIYSYRLKICQKLLDKVINKGDITQSQIDTVLHHIVGMNVIQTIYKNTTKEQKQDLEKQLKTNLVNTCNAIKLRIINQSTALKTIRDVHGIKTWMQVADKNFIKSLDRKCSEFKRNQRDNTKPQFFQAQIQQKIRYIKKKERPNIFQDTLSLFSILNSFESYSKTEKCLSHQIKPEEIPTYDLQKCPSKDLLPALMLLFENKEVTNLVYSFFIYYVNNCIPNDGERNKNKKIGSKFFEKILGFDYSIMNLPQNFRQQEFLDVLSKFNGGFNGTFADNMIVSEQSGPKLYEDQKAPQQIIEEKKQMNVKDSLEGQYAYLPLKTENSSIWYFSFNMYVVLRLIYTIYERVLKAFEILFNYQQSASFQGATGKAKVNLFKILFMIHVKSKQNSKFEDQLGDLFGLDSYMFSTIYKLFETLIKSFQSVSGDTFSSKLLDLITTQNNQSLVNNQTLYFIYVNRLTIFHNNSDNLLRINHNKSNSLMTVNFFKSAYKSWDDGRDKKLQEKLDDIQRNVQFYVTQPTIDHDPKNKNKKKDKKNNLLQGNKMQYFCFSSGLKLFSRVQYEDFYAVPGKKVYIGNKILKREVKRSKKTRQFLSAIEEEL